MFVMCAFLRWCLHWVRFCSNFHPILAPKIHQKRSKNRFRIKPNFGSIFTPIFRRFWLHFGTLLGPKTITKSIKNSMQFYIEKRTHFLSKKGGQMGSKGVPKREFWRSLGVSFSRPLQGTQNGCQMSSKWSQNSSKLELKLSEN